MRGEPSSYIPPPPAGEDDTEDVTAPLLTKKVEKGVTEAPAPQLAESNATPEHQSSSPPSTNREAPALAPPPAVMGYVITDNIGAPAVGQPASNYEDFFNNRQDVRAPVHIPDMPDVYRDWKKQQHVLSLWLVISALSLMLFWPFYLATGLFLGAEIAAMLGIAVSVIHMSDACRGMDLVQKLRTTAPLAIVACLLDMCTIFVNILLLVSSDDCDDDEEDCESIIMFVVFFSCYLLAHALVALYLVRVCHRFIRLLNPVTTGMVVI